MPTSTSLDLHDWTLLAINYDWETSTAVFDLGWQDVKRELVALKTTELSVPHSAPWGPSVSINQVEGPTVEESGGLAIKIEMQTGDVILCRAASIQLH